MEEDGEKVRTGAKYLEQEQSSLDKDLQLLSARASSEHLEEASEAV